LEPRPGHVPIPLCSAERNIENGRYLVKGQSAKEMQFHDSTGPGVQCVQAFHGLVQNDHIDYIGLPRGHMVVEGDLLLNASALGRAAFARVIDQNLAHVLGSEGEEVDPIPPRDILLSSETLPSFMDQSSGLESMIRPLTPHIAGG